METNNSDYGNKSGTVTRNTKGTENTLT